MTALWAGRSLTTVSRLDLHWRTAVTRERHRARDGPALPHRVLDHFSSAVANSSTSTDAMVLGGTAGSRTVNPESERGMVSGCRSARRYARTGSACTPVSGSVPSRGQSNTCTYTLPGFAV